MPKYIKRPLVIEAIQWTGDNCDDIWCEFPDCWGGGIAEYSDNDDDLVIRTLEGDMYAHIGDYIVKGIKGEFYPCKKDIFEESYTKLDDDIARTAYCPCEI